MKLNTVILLTYSLAMIGCASSLKGKSMYPDSSITYRNGYISVSYTHLTLPTILLV